MKTLNGHVHTKKKERNSIFFFWGIAVICFEGCKLSVGKRKIISMAHLKDKCVCEHTQKRPIEKNVAPLTHAFKGHRSLYLF